MTRGDLALLLGPPGLRILAGLGVGAGLLWLYRWMRARSPLAAGIFAAGFLLRAGLAVALFWISWLDLPLLRSMHLGNGFWALAPDAMHYTDMGARVALEGLDALQRGEASPSYAASVGLFMRLVGISPLTGMYLNLVVYGLLCGALVALWKPKNDRYADLPLLVLLIAFAFSPVQIIHGSQSLKDDVFAFVVAMGAVGVLFIAMPMAYGVKTVTPRWAMVAGAAAWLAAVPYAAGIRAYFAFFMFCSFSAVLLLFSIRPRWDTLYRRLPVVIVACILTGWVYMVGAGPYDNYVRGVLRVFRPAPGETQDTGLMALVVNRIDSARRGFAQSGGGTNIIAAVEVQVPVVVASSPVPLTPAAQRRQERAARAAERQAIAAAAASGGVVSRTALGLGTLFVPISLLQALSITNLTGGRGLLVVTDLDTLFVDATILASLAFLYLRWDLARRRLPLVCYLLLLGTVTALLLAYVVTNFGTLFRLRMLAVVPFWLLILATAESRLIPAAPDVLPASAPVPPDTSG